VLALTQIEYAQSGWTLVQRGGPGDLVSVFFTSSEKGWIGGDEGYLAKTTDGGLNWVRQPLNSKDNVNEIYFRNDDNGYLLAGKKIYLTKDGGKNWRENIIVNSKDYRGLTPEFLSIRFTNKKTGWIVGSVSNQRNEVVDSLILHTLDGGENWSRVPTSFRQELYHLDFVNDSDGWIVGDKGLILVTDDGGKTWMRQAVGLNVSLYNVDFRDSKNGVVVGGAGTILRTENGGMSWEKITSPVKKSLLRVNFIDDKAGWVVGAGGTILRTDDKGKTWIQQDSQTQDSLYGLYMEKKNGWAVGKKGIVLKYTR
jgi:photosystem II stability/assembly factor-like uncharacterized protein